MTVLFISSLHFKKMFFSERMQAGFTLIEILVVFSIVTILSGIGVAAFASYSRTQQLAQSANNIKLLVSEARFNSLSGVKTNRDQNGNTITCGNESLIGYFVNVSGTDQVELSMECANVSSQTVKVVTLPRGYTFGDATTCTQFRFDSLSATAGGVPCTMVLSGYGFTKTISIDIAGNASVQ
jgi:prepilin-type N-terminal cleavage/methylation domain-containing protein